MCSLLPYPRVFTTPFSLVMPMAHRIACLRDDLVFFIYLYQVYFLHIFWFFCGYSILKMYWNVFFLMQNNLKSTMPLFIAVIVLYFHIRVHDTTNPVHRQGSIYVFLLMLCRSGFMHACDTLKYNLHNAELICSLALAISYRLQTRQWIWVFPAAPISPSLQSHFSLPRHMHRMSLVWIHSCRLNNNIFSPCTYEPSVFHCIINFWYVWSPYTNTRTHTYTHIHTNSVSLLLGMPTQQMRLPPPRLLPLFLRLLLQLWTPISLRPTIRPWNRIATNPRNLMTML